MNEPQPIDLGALERRIAEQLHATELHCAELRGQLQLIRELAQLASGATITQGQEDEETQ